MKLSLAFKTARIDVELLETPTAKALCAALPFNATAQTWAEEVMVCFWTEGDALALPFGRTPISSDERPKLVGDPRQLAGVKAGDKVTVQRG